MTEGHKTLDEYLTYGQHEFVAFVRDRNSTDIGNKLGKTNFGVLVCKGDTKDDETQMAMFFYRRPSPNKGNNSSIIAWGDFEYCAAEVLSEVPLSIETSFRQGRHLEEEDEGYVGARELLEKHGL